MQSILLVEDDPSLGESLCSRLEREGYEVIWCKNIADSKRQISNFPFDIAIVDVGLPDGDGFSLAASLKSQNTPIVFLTAMNSPEFRLEAYEIGAEDYIPKPFHLKELLLRVRKVLDKYHLPQSFECKHFKLNFESGDLLFPSGERVQLQRKDAVLLSLLVSKSPEVVKREDVLELWQAGPKANTRTIDNSITRIRNQLSSVPGNPIRAVRGVGYLWELKA